MMMFYLSALPNPDDGPKFVEFYEKYKFLVEKIAFDKLHDHQHAEDCVQNVMLYFAEHFDKIDAVDSYSTRGLVRIVARSTAINEFNRIKNISK